MHYEIVYCISHLFLVGKMNANKYLRLFDNDKDDVFSTQCRI
jgi:hypothetical protein